MGRNLTSKAVEDIIYEHMSIPFCEDCQRELEKPDIQVDMILDGLADLIKVDAPFIVDDIFASIPSK